MADLAESAAEIIQAVQEYEDAPERARRTVAENMRDDSILQDARLDDPVLADKIWRIVFVETSARQLINALRDFNTPIGEFINDLEAGNTACATHLTAIYTVFPWDRAFQTTKTDPKLLNPLLAFATTLIQVRHNDAFLIAHGDALATSEFGERLKAHISATMSEDAQRMLPPQFVTADLRGLLHRIAEDVVLPPGERKGIKLMILGEAGTGKSTLGNAVAGVDVQKAMRGGGAQRGCTLWATEVHTFVDDDGKVHYGNIIEFKDGGSVDVTAGRQAEGYPYTGPPPDDQTPVMLVDSPGPSRGVTEPHESKEEEKTPAFDAADHAMEYVQSCMLGDSTPVHAVLFCFQSSSTRLHQVDEFMIRILELCGVPVIVVGARIGVKGAGFTDFYKEELESKNIVKDMVLVQVKPEEGFEVLQLEKKYPVTDVVKAVIRQINTCAEETVRVGKARGETLSNRDRAARKKRLNDIYKMSMAAGATAGLIPFPASEAALLTVIAVMLQRMHTAYRVHSALPFREIAKATLKGVASAGVKSAVVASAKAVAVGLEYLTITYAVGAAIQVATNEITVHTCFNIYQSIYDSFQESDLGRPLDQEEFLRLLHEDMTKNATQYIKKAEKERAEVRG
jgi:GTPase SAR1 family protein/uncharacterized protein (DUF697 family)